MLEVEQPNKPGPVGSSISAETLLKLLPPLVIKLLTDSSTLSTILTYFPSIIMLICVLKKPTVAIQ